MPRNWSHLAQRRTEDGYTEDDFKRAAYRLVTEQVLYREQVAQRTAYRLVVDHIRDFREALDLLGLTVEHEPEHNYVYARPMIDVGTPLSIEETLTILVLRKLYHDRVQAGEVHEGRTTVTVEELQSAYHALTERELKSASTNKELTALTDKLKRFGLARRMAPPEDSIQSFQIEILPAIFTLVDEQRLALLDEYARTAAAEEPRDVDEANEDTQCDGGSDETA